MWFKVFFFLEFMVFWSSDLGIIDGFNCIMFDNTPLQSSSLKLLLQLLLKMLFFHLALNEPGDLFHSIENCWGELIWFGDNGKLKWVWGIHRPNWVLMWCNYLYFGLAVANDVWLSPPCFKWGKCHLGLFISCWSLDGVYICLMYCH